MNKVRAIRTEQGMSISALSRKTGISRSIIYQLEYGKRDVQISTAQRIAAALGCTLNDLFGTAQQAS
jgi:transcriptional regulator with XRE-family HTH domain|nr:MAG TPA: helix-turn-helix domain protein [Bacteriophage sp.]